MTTVIQAEGLGKRYRLGERAAYRSLRDVLAGERSRGERTFLWALKDVSFSIAEGEVVGIIGRNGAGKSTLLKILSRITRPTEGRGRVEGRVGSLLEVGAGFHPELTGRENVFMNGAILGMTAAEIRSRFDAIVDFAGVERFIETPVKRYSSGMYVRLAFAVAAHLDPDILLVDEVLAVGDAAFQKKCLGRMNAVAREGRTVLLVSHNLGVLRETAQRGIWIDEGRVRFDGAIGEAVRRYLESGLELSAAEVDLTAHPHRLAGMKPVLKRLTLRNGSGQAIESVAQNDRIVLDLDYAAAEGMSLAGAGLIIQTDEGTRLGSFNTFMAEPPPHRLPPRGRVTFELPARQFTPGGYWLTVSCGSHSGALEDKIENVLRFTVQPADIYGTGYMTTREDGAGTLEARARVIAIA